MTASKITISLDRRLLARIDRLVKARQFATRSQAVQSALEAQLERLDKTRLARACEQLRPAEEQALADEGLSMDAAEWPAY